MDQSYASYLQEFLNRSQSGSSEMSRTLRENLIDCMILFRLREIFNKRFEAPPLDNICYISDLTLTDHCIRTNPAFLALWKACQVFKQHLQQAEIIGGFDNPPQSKLRTFDQNTENLKACQDYLQVGDYDKALKKLQLPQIQWISQVLQALQPEHNTDLSSQKVSQMCLLDFMCFPTNSFGNLNYLQTLQTLSQYLERADDQRVLKLFRWVLAKDSYVVLHSNEWYKTLLNCFRNALFGDVLSDLFNKKQLYEERCYFGYYNSYSLDKGQKGTNLYSDILKNIFKTDRIVSVQEKLYELIERNQPQRDQTSLDKIKHLSKRLQLISIAKEMRMNLNYSNIDLIHHIINVVSDQEGEVANIELVIELYFAWCKYAIEISEGQRDSIQDLLQYALLQIKRESQVSSQPSTSIDNYATRIFELLQYIEDEEYISEQITDVFKSADNKEQIMKTLKLMKFSENVRKRFAQLTMMENEEPSNLNESLILYQSLQLPTQELNESFLTAIRQSMYHYRGSQMNNIQQILSAIQKFKSENPEEKKEIDIYKSLIEIYQPEKITFDGLSDGLEKLFSKDFSDRYQKNEVQSILGKWTYKIIMKIIHQVEQDQEIGALMALIFSLRMSGNLSKVEDLQDILKRLPVEKSLEFIQTLYKQ